MPARSRTGLLFCLLLTLIVSLLFARSETLARTSLTASAPAIDHVADIAQPRSIALDNAGNVFTISRDTGILYKIAPTGEVSVIADLPDGKDGYAGLLFDHITGNLLVSKYMTKSGNQILQITPQGTVSVFAASVSAPHGMALDANDSLYASSYSCPGIVNKVTRDGQVTPFATGLCFPDGLAFGPDGDLFIGNRGTHQVMRVPAAGGQANVFANGLPNPMAVEFDNLGRLFVGNHDNGTIIVINSAGTASPFVDGLTNPTGIAFDQENQLYVAEYGANRIVKVQNDSEPTPTATPLPTLTPTVPVPPIAEQLTINGGALTTTSANVRLAVSAANPDGSQTDLSMSFSNDQITWSDWQPYAPTALWQLEGDDGLKRVYGRFRSSSEGISVTVSDTITLDTEVQAEYGLTINNGALCTNIVAVQLKISARPGTAEMQVSNDGGFEGAAWEPYTAHKNWQIRQYQNTEITMLVYVRFRDVDGNVTTASDSIILDINPPQGHVQVVDKDSTPRLKLTASDDISGVEAMEVSARPGFEDASWETLAASRSWDFEHNPVAYIRFRDYAGNISTTYMAQLEGEHVVFLPLVLR